MRIVVFEIHDRDSDIFDKIMEIVESHPDIECLRVRDEPMLSLPGLEIYPGRRKIYRDRRESSVVVIGGTPEISQPLAIMYEGEKAKVVPTNAMANDRLMRRAGLTACVCGMGRSPCGTATGRKTNAHSMCNQVREALRLLHFLLLILSPQSRDHDSGKVVAFQRLFKDPLWTFFLCSYVI